MSTHIVSFSGGKDSTALLFGMLDRGMPVDRVLFIDGGVEFPQMYDHIEIVRQKIAPIPLDTESFDFEYFLGHFRKTRGKMFGKLGLGWPDFRMRWCTQHKIVLARRYISRFTDPIEYHGIAFDERSRALGSTTRQIRYPMVDWKMFESQALVYCRQMGFSWGGLYDHFARVSCFCCPLKTIPELRKIYHLYPELWSRMQRMDALSFRRFRKNETLSDLQDRFQRGF